MRNVGVTLALTDAFWLGRLRPKNETRRARPTSNRNKLSAVKNWKGLHGQAMFRVNTPRLPVLNVKNYMVRLSYHNIQRDRHHGPTVPALPTAETETENLL